MQWEGRASNLLRKRMQCHTQELIAKNLECGGRMTYQVSEKPMRTYILVIIQQKWNPKDGCQELNEADVNRRAWRDMFTN